MGSKAFQIVYRPNKPEANGTLFQLDRRNFDWFDKLLHKYSNHKSLRKMLKRFPRIGGVQIVDNDEIVALITIMPKSNSNQFVVSHFTGTKGEADFSLLMILGKEGIHFSDITPNVTENDFKQVSNFVIGVHMYSYLMHIEKSVKYFTIEPMEFFGVDLV